MVIYIDPYGVVSMSLKSKGWNHGRGCFDGGGPAGIQLISSFRTVPQGATRRIQQVSGGIIHLATSCPELEMAGPDSN